MVSAEHNAQSRERPDLPGYQLLEQLGSGAHLATYRGLREADGAAVVVKMATSGASAQTVAQLEREFNLTRDLDDPGICSALSFQPSSEGYTLIFPDSAYIPLSRYQRDNPLPLSEFLTIGSQLASILGRIHNRDIVHKDIKPGNILLDPETLAVQITGFGIATTLARECPSHRAPIELEGSLAYIAPEQTGRMNRSVDRRSDLYALGVTFYQLLTGRLPFTSEEPAELVHQHIARIPTPPDTINTDIPSPLSALVMKLMAKEPEDRYQSSSGVLHDLRGMQSLLNDDTKLQLYKIGIRDIPGKLLLPERLYGRDRELKNLVKAADAAVGGRASLLKVAGYSGIGKSALIRELMRPVSGRQGQFISGKYDQLNRNTPYSAIIQAFAELARKLLTESRLDTEKWRDKLLEALGGNAQIILDLIPGFEHLLGPQAPVPELGPSESQYRFNLVFRRFVRALTTADYPLVIFLDDMQWADGASLGLLEVLMSDPDISNLLCICAYRDDEVNPGHPLLMLFKTLEQSGTPETHIHLTPLGIRSVEQLVADALHMPFEAIRPLSALIYAKTKGNPFFVRQFIRNLCEKDLLQFDTERMQWQWDVAQIEEQQVTDNVVELVAERIEGLNPESRALVQLGACIGNRFTLETLAIVSGQSTVDTATNLGNALQQEVIVPVGEAYKYAQGNISTLTSNNTIEYRFPHDRLHHAAYSTIGVSQRPAFHSRIGRLILEQSSESDIDERIFEISNHLNFAILEDTDIVAREQLARLNLKAGIKAKLSTSYTAALGYLTAGVEALGESGRDKHAELCFDLQFNLLEATYLTGQFDKAEQQANQLLALTDNTLKNVRVREILILCHISRLHYRRAITASVEALALLGVVIPGHPNKAQLALELARTRLALRGKTADTLLELPAMTDPHKLAAMRILQLAGAPAYFEDPNLMPYLAMRLVRLSVKYGNAAYSAYGYVLYAGVLCGVLKDMPAGLVYGKLALKIVERYNVRDIKGKVLQIFGGFVAHWNQPITETLPAYLEGASAALEAGDLEFHGYNRYSHLSYSFMSGLPLDQVWELIGQHQAAVTDHKHDKTQFIMQMMREAVRDLRGYAAENPSAEELAFDEPALLAMWAERDKQALTYYHKYRLVRNYMVRDYTACLENARVITEHYHTVVGMLFSSYYIYFEALALTGLAPSLSGLERVRALRRVGKISRILQGYAKHNPHAYQHKHLLVAAELQRVTGKPVAAESSYEEAARHAHQSGSLHDEALAYELLGEFQLERGRNIMGRVYLKEARKVYRRWGAFGWIAHLQQRHTALFNGDTSPGDTGSHTNSTATNSGEDPGKIDISTITHAARAISEKIVLNDVLKVILNAAVVNAGADKGLLLLLQGDQLKIKAETINGGSGVQLNSVSIAESNNAPVTLVNYVARSQESVVIDNVSSDTTFSTDPYFLQHKTRSVICLPLMEKGLTIGFLYLENALVHGAFTPARIQTLDILAAQAAISLENARLYRELSDHAEALEVKVKERTAELEDAYGMLQDIFGKYVPRRVAEEMAAGKGSMKPIKTTATILFSDIEGFTTISENTSPERVLEMLNEYFPAVLEPIERYGGVVHQFQGDAMLVTFNIPVADENHADNALRAAIGIQKAIAGRKFAGFTLRTRIGINTGEVIAGNVGSGDRISYTVHGDAVNLAARIEQLNKEYGTTILVSGTTADLLQDEYPLRPVGEVSIRGKSKPATLFDLSSEEPPS